MRLLALCFVAVVSALALAACGGESDKAEGSGKATKQQRADAAKALIVLDGAGKKIDACFDYLEATGGANGDFSRCEDEASDTSGLSVPDGLSLDVSINSEDSYTAEASGIDGVPTYTAEHDGGSDTYTCEPSNKVLCPDGEWPEGSDL